MRIIYRMRGLLGDATEEFIESLDSTTGTGLGWAFQGSLHAPLAWSRLMVGKAHHAASQGSQAPLAGLICDPPPFWVAKKSL